MPTIVVPSSTLADVPSKERAALKKLLYERAVLGFSFSYSKLFKLLTSHNGDKEDPEAAALSDIERCILAHDDTELKGVKQDINDQITALMGAHDIRSLEITDPWETKRRFTYYESSTSSLNKNLMVQKGPSLGISTDKVLTLIESCTVTSKYTALRCEKVKEKE